MDSSGNAGPRSSAHGGVCSNVATLRRCCAENCRTGRNAFASRAVD